jgi:serine/threonine-protein kinase
MIPEQLGPYRLGRRLGRGGMGAVYEGVNVETGEKAAVKVLSGAFSQERDFRQRFASEIETLRRLRHPHIVRLFGFGEQEDQLFYAMELVDGVSLEEELIQGRRFQWQEVLRIAQETCDALRHAHDRGVIHRDIKPANLLLAEDESLKLSDFGIAKMFGHSQQTAVGSVIGTVEYMAPEQADARPVDARTDLYSLGGVLYALLVGRAPLVADSLPEMLRKQRHERPEPLERLVTGVPSEFAGLIHQLLEKDPARRIPNARLLARVLDALGAGLLAKPAELAGPRSESTSEGDGQDEFVVGRPGASAGPSDPLGMMPTRAIEDEDEPVTPPPPPDPNAPLPETMATDAFQLAATGADDSNHDAAEDKDETTEEAEPAKKSPVTHFTPVGEEELDPTLPPEKSDPPVFSLQTLILVVSLLAVGCTIWYFLLPPSADSLYERIMTETEDVTIGSMYAARDDIEEFLHRYSDDPRGRRLRSFQRRLELDELESQFDRYVKRREEAQGLLPVQQAYLEARKYLWLEPELGIAKLRALIDLYSHEADASGPTGLCLELARLHLETYQEIGRKMADEQKELVQSRLDMADKLKDSDPGKARKMYASLIELYDGKPWAAELVKQARQSLDEMEP